MKTLFSDFIVTITMVLWCWQFFVRIYKIISCSTFLVPYIDEASLNHGNLENLKRVCKDFLSLTVSEFSLYFCFVHVYRSGYSVFMTVTFERGWTPLLAKPFQNGLYFHTFIVPKFSSKSFLQSNFQLYFNL